MLDTQSTQPIHVTDGLAATQDIPEQRTLPCLTVVHHPDSRIIGKRLVFRPQTRIEFGRGDGLLGAGALDDVRISRRHCEVVVERSRLVVRDLDSLNGTFVNDTRTGEKALAIGDLLCVGPVLLMHHNAAGRRTPHPTLIGGSAAVGRVIRSMESVAPYQTTVLILGESGTGKELVARAIHEASRRPGPLLMVNSGGMPDGLLHSELFGHVRGAFSGANKERQGLIDAASAGTLFLDEVG